MNEITKFTEEVFSRFDKKITDQIFLLIQNDKELMSKYNIKVEMVKARGTSQLCSCCGETGNRKGKQFVCHYCGFSCDSDLNAARNITTAQLSYGAISVIGG